MVGRDINTDHIIEFLEIPLSVLHKMLESLEKVYPEEGCGILAGKNHRVEKVINITNILHEPTRYLMDANEQLEAFIFIDENDLELLAIYHSHPSGNTSPSQTDLDEFLYPNVVTLIAHKSASKWTFAGYLINNNHYHVIPLKWIE